MLLCSPPVCLRVRCHTSLFRHRRMSGQFPFCPYMQPGCCAACLPSEADVSRHSPYTVLCHTHRLLCISLLSLPFTYQTQKYGHRFYKSRNFLNIFISIPPSVLPGVPPLPAGPRRKTFRKGHKYQNSGVYVHLIYRNQIPRYRGP